MLIQGEDGQIRERNSYGNDPHPAEGLTVNELPDGPLGDIDIE